MFKIYDGREHFYQWDLDRKLIIEDPSVIQVHFCNRTDNCSLVCETYVEDGITLVNVPNILLQTDWKIHVYAYDGKHTKFAVSYDVASRTKPADYAYTETEILNWSKIDEEVAAAIAEMEAVASNVDNTIQTAIEAIDMAYDAASNAEVAKDTALIAADEAFAAAESARAAADYAIESASGVVEATDNANAAATLATNAATNANAASEAATETILEANESIVNANTAASNASSAIEAAVGATNVAYGAANAANEAAASANDAADNANTAATKANNAASGINDKFANALKGNKSGEIVAITDISPIEHNVAVKASSKNLLPYPYNRQTLTSAGITFTANDDSSVTVVGTTTGTANFELTRSVVLEGGKTYTFYSGSTNTTVLITYSVDGATKYLTATKESASLAWKDNYKLVSFGIRVSLGNGVTVNETVYPMIYEGTTATAYTPYVPDVSAATVSTLGKNLIDYTKASARSSASTVVVNDDGSITYTGDYYFRIPVSLKRGKAYTLSFDGGVNAPGWCFAYSSNNNISPVKVPGGAETTKTDEDVQWIFIYPYSRNATVATTTISNIQLELGAAPTDYEPYIEPTSYPIAADGTVEGVTSIYPNMTITTDTTGVLVDTEYNRDLNKAFAELQNALISLGGNV